MTPAECAELAVHGVAQIALMVAAIIAGAWVLTHVTQWLVRLWWDL